MKLVNIILSTDVPDEIVEYLSMPQGYEFFVDLGIAAILTIVAVSIYVFSMKFVIKKYWRK